MIFLIENNYINEERFAKSLVRGKHNYKKWGKKRINIELKAREISSKNIELALQEIPKELYIQNFNELAEKHWNSITEKNSTKKNKNRIKDNRKKRKSKN